MGCQFIYETKIEQAYIIYICLAASLSISRWKDWKEIGRECVLYQVRQLGVDI